MLRSMYSSIGGLRNFQNKLDVIGNNIANVNTPGFKKSRITFQDILSQTTAGGNAPNATMGGTNPKQIGLGSTIAAIDVVHTQGGPQTTNVPTDLAIQGNGFFVVAPDATKVNKDTSATPPGTVNGILSSNDYFLTRAGNFSIDAEGNLVTANGMFVMGRVAEYTYDANKKEFVVAGDPELQKINLLTNMNGDRLVDKNNVPVKVKSYSIGTDGTLTVTYDNEPANLTNATANPPDPNPILKKTVGVATVTNPAGLEKAGNNLYRVTEAATGTGKTTMYITDDAAAANGVNLGFANSGDRGPIYASTLEMSNVDLAEEFTEMIVAQRGFQANSRTITTSDSILEELVNLKR